MSIVTFGAVTRIMAKATLALQEVSGDGDFDLWLRKFEVIVSSPTGGKMTTN